jgi:oxygen-dependent protoporphyrinogen oxidase
MHDVVIIGAGISGLSAAWELVQRGHRPVVLERATRAGGVILTEQHNGFVVDAGPDSLLVQKPAAIELCRELGLGSRLVPTLPPRTAFVQRAGRLHALPEASILGIPTRVKPFLESRLFSWPGKLRMGAELLVPPRRDDADESIGAFIGRRFGHEAVTYLAEPLLAGIHAGDVDRLSIKALFPRLREAETSHGSVLKAFRARGPQSDGTGAFRSLPEGLGELVGALVAQLPINTIRFAASVTKLERAPDRVVVEDGSHLDARAIIVATPAWAAAQLFGDIDAEIAKACGDIRYASTVIVVLGYKREQIAHPLNGTGYVVPRVERRGVMAATFVSSKWPDRAPDGHVLLRAFIGGTADPHAIEASDEALLLTATQELTNRLRITGVPVFARVVRWPRASVQHEVGHLARVEAIDRRLAALPGVFVTGSGFRGTGIPDCVADGRATGARVAAFLHGR